MRYQCVSRTHVGLKRKINEDALFSAPETGLWAVADGMGGHDAGEVASAMVVDALAGVTANDGLDRMIEDASQAVLRANASLLDLAGGGLGQRTIGTTVVGLALSGDEFRCFWAGDSRAYRSRGGTIERLTRDHSLVQSLVDAGMLKPEEAETHENASVITRAVGVTPELALETVGGASSAGDRFLLASDGLTRVVNDRELAAELAAPDLEKVADSLIARVLERGAPDNVTLIIVELS